MASRKWSRRALAVGLATAATAAAVPASADAEARFWGCKWPNPHRITIWVNTAAPLNAGYANLVMYAAAYWNSLDHVTITGASSAATANILVQGGPVAYGSWGRTNWYAIRQDGACVGQTKITIDNKRILARPRALELAQWTVSHEIGHALGLGEDYAYWATRTCPGHPYYQVPRGVMWEDALDFDEGFCGPKLAAVEDLMALEKRYPRPPSNK